MLVRLTPQQGGDGTVHRIIVINDTGSNLLTLFDTDMSLLGNLQGYTGWRGDATVTNASGITNNYRRLRVQVQLVRDDDSPWSNWIDELAVIKPASQEGEGGEGFYIAQNGRRADLLVISGRLFPGAHRS